MAHRHKRHHRAKGGHAGHRLIYTGAGSNVAKEAESTGGGFRKGGKVHGHKGKHRLDKRARGGRSGSPFSTAHHGHHHEGGPAHHPEPHHSKHKGAVHTGPTHHERPI